MLTNEIIGGEFDDYLDSIVVAVQERKRILSHRKFDDLRIDDRVKIVGDIKPRYAQGFTGTVVEKRITKVVVLMDQDLYDPYGKWAGKRWILPVSILEVVLDEQQAPV